MSPHMRFWLLLVVAVLGVSPRSGLGAADVLEPQEIMRRMANAYDGIKDYTALFLKRVSEARLRNEIYYYKFA